MTAAPERGPRWLEYVPLDELRPDPRNPKNHRLDTLRESVVRWGYSEPVQVDERTGLIVSGHGRRELLLDDRATGRPAPDGVVVDGAGGWLVPVVRGWSSTDDDEAFGYLVAANRIGEQGGWLTERLLAGLEPLAAKGPDMLAGVGYTPDDLSGLLALLQSEQEPSAAVGGSDPDEVPEPPPEPVSRRGDLWLCGPHRVLCGDSTKKADVLTLLGDRRPDLLLTDPPYGVSYGSGTTDAKAIRGDLGQAVIPVGFAVALEVLSDNARLYLFGGSGQFAMYLTLWDHFLHDLPRVIVWVKESFVLRQLGYHSQFELVYWGWKGAGGGRDYWFGDRSASDVWDLARDREHLHPTQKPVALLEIPLLHSLQPGGLVLDPFAGSGSTLMAAERTGRVAALVELDPGHCDTILRRYQAYTGIVPVLESTGEPHDFCAEPEPAVSDR